MTAVTCRPIAAGDLGRISVIHTAACRIAYGFMNWDYSLYEVRRWYETEKLPEWDWGLLAERSGTGVGFVAMAGRHLDQLFVHPDAWRQGIGTTLLGRALARGIRPMTLDVFELNAPARRLYERYGFAVTERTFDEEDRAYSLRCELR